MARHYGDPDHGYGLLTILARTESKQRVCLINLGTEALQTFRILTDRGFRPRIIVLQDHGTGGNWDGAGFGGRSRLHAAAGHHLPELHLRWRQHRRVACVRSGLGMRRARGGTGSRRAIWRLSSTAQGAGVTRPT